MGEIVAIVVVLGVMFLFLWAVVLILERQLGRRKGEGTKEGKAGSEEEKMAFIVAGVIAYEYRVEKARGKGQRVVYEKKEERVSWWRISRRMG